MRENAPSLEASVADRAREAREGPRLDRAWGRGGNALCLATGLLLPKLSTRLRTVSSAQQTTGSGLAPGPRRGLRSPLRSLPPAPALESGGEGWERGTGGFSAVHLKHHLRVITREKERHRLHRLRAAPGLPSAASPALRAFSSSHIRRGGGRGAARGAAAAGGGVGTAHAGRP